MISRDLSAARILAFCLGLFLSGCAAFGPAPSAPPDVRGEIPQTARVLREGTQRSAKGRTYSYLKTDDRGAQAATYDARQAERQLELAAVAAVDAQVNEDDWFRGRARAEAKTSIAHAKLTKYSSLKALLTSLERDDEMDAYDPPIRRDTPRVREELRNVGLCTYIVGTKREEDNDYHVIIGDGGKTYMNTEIPGIPRSGSETDKRTLLEARRAFEAFVEAGGRGTGTYTAWGDPVPVYVEGSLFFDIEHVKTKVGPGWAKPKTAWEIHPITRIEFEPESCP